MAKLQISLAAILVLAGCAADQTSETSLLQHGYSVEYVDGYHEGCRSGKRAGGDSFAQRSRDAQAYSAGGDYRTGWDYGYVTCRDAERQNELVAGMIGTAIAAGVGQSHGADGVDVRKIMSGIDTTGLQDVNW